jgi:hypothetical protein
MPRGRRKRPADVIGNAIKVMRIATGQTGGLWTFPPNQRARTLAFGRKGGKPRAAALGKRMNALRRPGRRGGVRRVAALQFGRSGLGADIVDPTRLTLSRQCARGPTACSCSTGGTLAVWQQPSPHISACASAVAFEKFEICTLIPLSSSRDVFELHTPGDSRKSFASQLR